MVENINQDIIELAQQFPELTSGVEAQRTLAWLQAKSAGEPITQTTRLWLITSPNHLNWSVQLWQPPDDWKEWPSFDVESESWLKDRHAVRTVTMRPEPAIEWQGDALAERGRAMQILSGLVASPHGAAAAILHDQASAWLDTALGRIGRVSSPDTGRDLDFHLLLEDLITAVLPFRSSVNADLMEDCLQLVYGSARSTDQTSLVFRAAPQGQSYEWRDYFQALSRNLSREHTLMAVQLSALALRSESVWMVIEALRHTYDGRAENEELLHLSVCVRRRWLLAVKALAWVEVSLHRLEPFEVVTPADLMCFATAALLPLYPRPLVGVSHRSGDRSKC